MDAGVQVFGVSTDSVEKHARFRASLELPFPLLADVEGTLSTSYDAAKRGKNGVRSARKMVLVDKGGTIRYRDEAFKVGSDAAFAAVVAAVEAL